MNCRNARFLRLVVIFLVATWLVSLEARVAASTILDVRGCSTRSSGCTHDNSDFHAVYRAGDFTEAFSMDGRPSSRGLTAYNAAGAAEGTVTLRGKTYRTNSFGVAIFNDYGDLPNFNSFVAGDFPLDVPLDGWELAGGNLTADDGSILFMSPVVATTYRDRYHSRAVPASLEVFPFADINGVQLRLFDPAGNQTAEYMGSLVPRPVPLPAGIILLATAGGVLAAGRSLHRANRRAGR